MQTLLPDMYKKIYNTAVKLTEELGYSPQEIEFTFESDHPDDFYILQTRYQDLKTVDSGKSKTESSFVFENPTQRIQLSVGHGIGIGGGAMNGLAAFNAQQIKELREKYPDDNVILVRPDTVPDDIGMIFDCDGLLTARGGATSHAAVTAVRLGKVCVVNCDGLDVDIDDEFGAINGHPLKMGDKIAIDGNLGLVYLGHYKVE